MKFIPFTTVLILACLLFNNARSQIIIEKNDFPQIGDAFLYNRVDPVSSSFDLLKTQQIFDLDISQLNVSGVDTLEIVPPTSRAEGAFFPESEMAVVTKGSNTLQVNYLKTQNDTVFLVGMYFDLFGDGSLNDYHVDPYAWNMHAPLSFLDSSIEITGFLDTIYNPSTFPGTDTFIIKALATNRIKVDGYGTVKIPNHKPINVLRVKVTQERHDTAYLHNTQTKQWTTNSQDYNLSDYFYYAKGVGQALVKVTLNSADVIENIVYINRLDKYLGVGFETNSSTIEVVPNPASDYLGINSPKWALGQDCEYSIVDITGKQHHSGIIFGEKQTVPVHNLPNGIYVLEIRNKKIRQTKKLVIQH